MKKENIFFIGFLVLIAVVAGGYIIYEQSSRNAAPASQVSFPNSQSHKNKENEPREEREEQYPEGDKTEEERNATEISQLTASHPSLLEEKHHTANKGSGLSMDPTGIINPLPVSPLEQGDSEAAEASHNLRIRNSHLESRVTTQVRDIETLRTRVSELNETIVSLTDNLEEQQRISNRLQRTTNAQVQQNQQPSQRTSELSSSIELVRISGDQAWLRTPDGRTYIAEQGDSVGSEFIIGIESDRVVTSSGEISQ